MDELLTIKAPAVDCTSSFSKCDAAIAQSVVTFRLDYRCEQQQLQAPMQDGSIPLPVWHVWFCARLTGGGEDEAGE